MKNDHSSVLRASERVAWRLFDVLAEEDELDFSKPFLPESLVQAEALSFLDEDERRVLNHIRAHGYLCIFGLVEEFILPFVLKRLEARADSYLEEVRALLSFASEEAKHIALFLRFRSVFERGFGRTCEVIGPPRAIAERTAQHRAQRRAYLGAGITHPRLRAAVGRVHPSGLDVVDALAALYT